MNEMQQCHDDLIKIFDQVQLQMGTSLVAQLDFFDDLMNWKK